MPAKRLTPELVKEARRRAAAGEQCTDIAEELSVAVSTLTCAVNGTSWKRITDPPPVALRTGRNKLTAAMVREARRRVAAGETVQEIAGDYPVTESGVNSAVRGFSWAHITDPPPIPAEGANTTPTSSRTKLGDALVADAMPPPGATPCNRCGVLCLGRYCRYCYEEGHAPSYAVAETSHPIRRWHLPRTTPQHSTDRYAWQNLSRARQAPTAPLTEPAICAVGLRGSLQGKGRPASQAAEAQQTGNPHMGVV